MAQIHVLQEVMFTRSELREQTANVIRRFKINYCSFLSGMPPFKMITTTSSETLMGLMTHTRLQLQPALGRIPKSGATLGP